VLKILQVHNQYQNPTGDDAVVQEEHDLLRSKGHDVIQYFKSNEVIDGASLSDKIRMAFDLKSSKIVKKEFEVLLEKEMPDIVHAHNLFPLISPVIFEVCKNKNIPTVLTLHNYRLLCVNTLFYRGKNICEDCLSKNFFQGVKHKCYNNSYLQSYLMANAIISHKKNGTWSNEVNAFICLSEFAKTKFIKGGLPENKLTVKPNFVNGKKSPIGYEDYFLYAGKLEEQKGVNDFIELAKSLKETKFKVAGYCEDPNTLVELANVEYLGELRREKLIELMSQCKAVLFLSKMYEGMPMTILEAFANSKAVIGRNLGAMEEMINDGSNGILFEKMEELKEAVIKLSNSEIAKEMGEAAFDSYLKSYSPDLAYNNLLNVYESIL